MSVALTVFGNTVNPDAGTGDAYIPLADIFVRQVKLGGRPAGDSRADGAGMYLLAKLAGKCWCMGYRFAAKRKTELPLQESLAFPDVDKALMP